MDPLVEGTREAPECRPKDPKTTLNPKPQTLDPRCFAISKLEGVEHRGPCDPVCLRKSVAPPCHPKTTLNPRLETLNLKP